MFTCTPRLDTYTVHLPTFCYFLPNLHLFENMCSHVVVSQHVKNGTLFGSKDIVWQQGYTNYKVTDMAAAMDFASLNLDCNNSPLSNYDRLQV